MDIEAAIIDLLRARPPEGSICPSEVARALEGDRGEWRALMPTVRDGAARLARRQIVRITQGERQLAPDYMDAGPVRLRRGAGFPER